MKFSHVIFFVSFSFAFDEPSAILVLPVTPLGGATESNPIKINPIFFVVKCH